MARVSVPDFLHANPVFAAVPVKDLQALAAVAREQSYRPREVIFSEGEPALFLNEIEKLTGSPREHLEFTMWYLVQKKLVQRTDQSMLTITADGIDWLEERHRTIPRTRRLAAANP